MGPNGAGKSTLSYVLAGKEDYEVTEGEILFNGENILDMEVDERAASGIFLAFQYPMEIPGVATMNFLKAAMNAQRKARSEAEYTTPEFIKKVKKIVSDGVNALRDPARAFLVITHYQRLLDHIVPDTVHVLYNGRIIKTGDKSLALHLEENGYADVIASAA